MNNNLKPIDQLLDSWKASLTEQVPALYKQYKEKREAIRLNHELDLYLKLEAQASLKSAYGKIVVEYGYDSVYNPARFAAFLDKEAASKKADIIDRCNDKAGGIDEVEWTYIGPMEESTALSPGPKAVSRSRAFSLEDTTSSVSM